MDGCLLEMARIPLHTKLPNLANATVSYKNCNLLYIKHGQHHYFYTNHYEKIQGNERKERKRTRKQNRFGIKWGKMVCV